MAGPPEIILASASPRRAALLRQIGLSFRIQPSSLDENGAAIAPGETPEVRAGTLARAKAEEVAAGFDRGLVIGADTIVVCEGTAFGKPGDRDEAQRMLLRLAGRSHRVVTGIALVQASTRRVEVATAVTLVHMRAFDRVEAAAYVATGEPLDKAGAYAIQGRGALLVEAIQGDYSTVVGLPLPALAALLRRFDVNIWKAADPRGALE